MVKRLLLHVFHFSTFDMRARQFAVMALCEDTLEKVKSDDDWHSVHTTVRVTFGNPHLHTSSVHGTCMASTMVNGVV